MDQRAADDLARVDLGAVDGAAEHFLEGDRAVAGVEEQHREHFMRQAAQALREIAAGGLGVGQGVAALQAGGEVAVAQLQRREQGAGPGRADARQLQQLFWRVFQQAAQRAMFGQQPARAAHHVRALQAGAQEDRQQFGVGQHRGAALEQLFARTFVVGPIADLHGGRSSRV